MLAISETQEHISKCRGKIEVGVYKQEVQGEVGKLGERDKAARHLEIILKSSSNEPNITENEKSIDRKITTKIFE